MFLRLSVFAAVVGTSLGFQALAQPARVDFGRDVLPIFRQNCFGCHGPSLATSGLRLDRKSSVFKAGARRVVPGSSQNSFLYHRLIGAEYGMQMPPAGRLKDEQIATIKAWIDQGAAWPDSLSKESDRAPLNPKAVAAVEMLRAGNRKGFLKALAADPQLANARGPEGSTPFMYAALYGDAAMLEQLLAKGANANAKNDAGATALMWAASSLEKTRVLLAHGADVNAISDDLRTPLMAAAAVPTGRPIVRLLLEHGANVNPTRHPDTESSPLVQAAQAADPEIMQMLIDRGADVKASAVAALITALVQGCRKCADLLISRKLDPMVYTVALSQVAPFADVGTMRALLDHGAQVDAPDPLGHTALSYAAGSDLVPVETVKLLIERGANVNQKSPHKNSGDTGLTILDVARLRGETPVVDLLVKAGAKGAAREVVAPKPRPAASVESAIRRSLPLLQRADAGFTAKSGCISCHNDSLAATAVGLARARGFRVDEAASAAQVKVNVLFLERARDALHQGYYPGAPDVVGPAILAYVLIGLDAEGHKPDLNTDAVAMYIKSHQMAEGYWPYPVADTRPPLCSGYIGQTVLAMRALQLYAPRGEKAEYAKAVARAAAWVAQAEPKNTEDCTWRVQGLGWAGLDRNATEKARRGLMAMQRDDGGWADLPTLPSSVFATGHALAALDAAGLPVSNPVYRRGVAYLLRTQLEDGSWFVRTRAFGFQPFFETGFPHGVNQSISAAGSSWATIALTLVAQPPVGAGGTQARR